MSNYGPPGNDPYGQQPPNPYGAPHGATGGQEPVKTDVVSIIALVASVLCCGLVGLILGIIGLTRTKNGQRKGRWAAIVGIVLGLLGMLAVGGFFVFAAVFGGESVDSLKAGQCVNAEGLDDSDDPVSQIEVVSCSDSHDGEVLATKDLSGDEASGFSSSDAIALCEPELSDAESGLTQDPAYLFIGLTQSDEPSSGDRLACIISNADGSALDEKLGD